MAVVALVVFFLYVALASVRPLVASYRRTGDFGFRTTPGVGRVIGALLPIAYGVVALGVFRDRAGAVDRIEVLDGPVLEAIGIALAAAGLPLIVVAQNTMGLSWRIGVDYEERTDLITNGPFRRVRNPIYSAMILMALGIMLIVPNVFTVVGLAIFLVAIELQVRVVEEPFLTGVHGDAYRTWAARTGRFVPGVGTLGR